MYDEDPNDNVDKCNYCELWAHCTTQKKDEEYCFDPSTETGKNIAKKMGLQEKRNKS